MGKQQKGRKQTQFLSSIKKKNFHLDKLVSKMLDDDRRLPVHWWNKISKLSIVVMQALLENPLLGPLYAERRGKGGSKKGG